MSRGHGPDPGVRTLRLAAPPGSFMDHVVLSLVGEGPFALIDAGYAERAAEALAWLNEEAGGAIEALLLTHHHRDHLGGAAALCAETGASAYAHPAEIGLMGSPKIEDFRGPLMAERAPELKPIPLEDGAKVRAGGVELEAVLTPGHSPGHLAFWWEERGVLFGGDVVLLPTTTSIVPPLGNLRDYLRSLERLRALRPVAIYPGHGPIVREPAGRIEALLRHRAQREAQVLEALAAGLDTPERMAGRIYAGLGERQMAMGAAMVVSHLEKLIGEGRVRAEAGRYALTG